MKKIVIGAGVVIVIVASIAATVILRGDRAGAFLIDRMFVVDDQLFTIEHVKHATDGSNYTSRISIYDLASGELSSRQVLARWRGRKLDVKYLGPGGDGHLWWHDPKRGVHIRSAKTGALIQDQAGLLSGSNVELLESQNLQTRVVYDSEKRGVALALKNGDYVWISSTLDVSMVEERPESKYDGYSVGTKRATLTDGQDVRVDREGAIQGVYRFFIKTEFVEESDTRMDPFEARGPRLFYADFLNDCVTTDPIVFDDPVSLLLVHGNSAESDATVLLSRVPGSGEPVWTRAIEGHTHDDSRIQITHYGANTIAMVIQRSSKRELLGFDPRDGSPRYRIDL